MYFERVTSRLSRTHVLANRNENSRTRRSWNTNHKFWISWLPPNHSRLLHNLPEQNTPDTSTARWGCDVVHVPTQLFLAKCPSHSSESTITVPLGSEIITVRQTHRRISSFCSFAGPQRSGISPAKIHGAGAYFTWTRPIKTRKTTFSSTRY